MAVRRPDNGPSGATTAEPFGGRLRGAAAAKLHVTLVVGLAVCIAAFVIEVARALGGNSLSWAYVFEWPIFAVFAVYMWWILLHDPDGDGRAARRPPAGPTTDAAHPRPNTAGDRTPPVPEGVDPDLAAWQAYLRDMEAAEADDPDGPLRR